MINLNQAAPVIAVDLRNAEHSAMAAARDLAHLIATTADANLNLEISTLTATRPIATIHEAMAGIVSSQRLLRRAHGEFEAIARALGVTEEMWGGSYPKPDPEAEDAPLSASEASIIA